MERYGYSRARGGGMNTVPERCRYSQQSSTCRP